MPTSPHAHTRRYRTRTDPKCPATAATHAHTRTPPTESPYNSGDAGMAAIIAAASRRESARHILISLLASSVYHPIVGARDIDDVLPTTATLDAALATLG